MKNAMFAIAIASAGLCSTASAQISANIDIGQPGFYGTINIGDDRPRLYASQPVIIERREHYVAQPVYLRVPPGHRKNWRKHCSRYNACGQRVLFVRDDWYQNTYAPRYRSAHGYAAQPVRVVERRVVEHHYVDRDKHHGKHKDKHHGKHQDKHHGKHKD